MEAWKNSVRKFQAADYGFEMRSERRAYGLQKMVCGKV